MEPTAIRYTLREVVTCPSENFVTHQVSPVQFFCPSWVSIGVSRKMETITHHQINFFLDILYY